MGKKNTALPLQKTLKATLNLIGEVAGKGKRLYTFKKR